MRALALLALAACQSVPPEPADSADSGEAAPAWSDPATCAEDVPLGSQPGFLRWPYLQHVTEDAATIAFGMGPHVDDGRVTLSRDGDWTSSGLAADTSVDVVRLDDSDDDDLPEAERGQEVSMALHHVRIEGLEPGTEYCYRVEADGAVMASGIRFRTAPADKTARVRFMVIGDMGSGTEDQDLVRDVMLRYAEGAHFILTTGDNAYSDGDRDELHERVFVVYQDMFARMPVYPTPGNHDYKTDEAQPYLDHFFLPEDAWREKDRERYYTVGFGPVHWIALDSETPSWEASPTWDDDQTDWLAGHAVHTERPWPIAGFHQPAKAGHPDRGPHLVALMQWAPILEENNVPLVLQGHDHYYERFTPIKQHEPAATEEGGVTYIVTAGGGRGLYEIDYEEPFMESAEQRHHFLLGEADGCTLTLQAVDVYDEVFDEVTFERCG